MSNKKEAIKKVFEKLNAMSSEDLKSKLEKIKEDSKADLICNECGNEFKTSYEWICPSCKSDKVQEIEGSDGSV